MNTYYFVRHGQTEYNQQHIVQGRYDSPLTAEGRREADRAGQYLADIPFAGAFTGGQGRQQETAQRILAANKSGSTLAPVALPGLREVDFGPFDGGPEAALFAAMRAVFEKEHGAVITTEELRALTHRDVNGWKQITASDTTRLQYLADDTHTAESPEHLTARTLDAFRQIREAFSSRSGADILVVSSGNALAALLPALTGEKTAQYFLHHGGICVMEEDAGTCRIRDWDVLPFVSD